MGGQPVAVWQRSMPAARPKSRKEFHAKRVNPKTMPQPRLRGSGPPAAGKSVPHCCGLFQRPAPPNRAVLNPIRTASANPPSSRTLAKNSSPNDAKDARDGGLTMKFHLFQARRRKWRRRPRRRSWASSTRSWCCTHCATSFSRRSSRSSSSRLSKAPTRAPRTRGSSPFSLSYRWWAPSSSATCWTGWGCAACLRSTLPRARRVLEDLAHARGRRQRR